MPLIRDGRFAIGYLLRASTPSGRGSDGRCLNGALARPQLPTAIAASSPLRAGWQHHHEVSSMTMSQMHTPVADDFSLGRPVVFRNATVLTIDPTLGGVREG